LVDRCRLVLPHLQGIGVRMSTLVAAALIWAVGLFMVKRLNDQNLEAIQAALKEAAEDRAQAIAALDERLQWCHQWREDAISLVARLEQLPEIMIVPSDGQLN